MTFLSSDTPLLAAGQFIWPSAADIRFLMNSFLYSMIRCLSVREHARIHNMRVYIMYAPMRIVKRKDER